MLLLLFGALNSGGRIQELGNIPYVTFFLPGILAYGIIITQFVNMAGGIAIQRDNGLLKRMRGTPLPGWAYVAGRLGSTAAGLGRHDRRHARARPRRASTCTCAPRRCRPSSSPCCWAPPPSPRWAWPRSCSSPTPRPRPVVANVLILPLSFISGIWYPLTGAPEWLVDVAKFFPVERLANALHVAFDPLNHGSAWSGNDLCVLGHLAARRHAPGDALLAAGDGALSAQRPRIASGCPRRASRASSRSSSRCPPSSGCWATSPAPGALVAVARRARRLLRASSSTRCAAGCTPSRRRSSRAPTSSTWPSPPR